MGLPLPTTCDKFYGNDVYKNMNGNHILIYVCVHDNFSNSHLYFLLSGETLCLLRRSMISKGNGFNFSNFFNF